MDSVGAGLVSRDDGRAPAIELAVGQRRQGGDDDVSSRQHVLGETGREELPDGARPRRRGPVRHDIGDEPVLGVAMVDDHRGVADAVEADERGLHFRELDAVAANLDLDVPPPGVLEAPVGAHHSEVAGLVDAHLVVERIRGESGAAGVGPAPEARREIAAADGDLPLGSRRQRRAVVVDDPHVVAGHRVADRHRDARHRGVVIQEEAAERQRFGRPHPVHQHAGPREVPAKELGIGPPDRLGAEVDEPQIRPGLVSGEGSDEVAEEGGNRPVDGDALLDHPRGERAEPLAAQIEREQRAAVEEAAVDRPDRVREADRGHQQEAIVGAEVAAVRVVHHVVEHVAVARARRPSAVRWSRTCR